MASTFDPNAWLSKQDIPIKAPQGFDPNAWLAKQDQAPAQAPPPEVDQAQVENDAMIKKLGIPQKVMRALGYLSGNVRTGAAVIGSAGKQAYQAAQANDVPSAWNALKQNVVTDQNIKDALNPLSDGPPSASEYADRLGIPKGGSISDMAPGAFSAPGSGGLFHMRGPEKGGPLDWTPRGVALTLGEAATDPLNSVMAKMGTTPIQDALQSTGKYAYRSGLKIPDIAAENMGKGPNAVSDLFFKNGITGSPASIATQSDNLAQKLLDQRNAMINQATEAGAHPNMEQALAPAKTQLQSLIMSGDPSVQDILPALKEKLASYQNSSPIDLNAQSSWKTNLYNALPQSAWANAAKTSVGKDFQKTMARGLKEDIENSANGATPGLGDNIADTNADLGTTLSAQKYLDNEAAKSIRRNNLTSVDPMVFALGHTAGIGAPALAAKKGADILKGSWARTVGGKAFYDAGQNIPFDNLVRQPSFWEGLNNQQKDMK